jgi:hypothetical protein
VPAYVLQVPIPQTKLDIPNQPPKREQKKTDSILSLLTDRRRRTSDPEAKILISLPEHKLLGRSKAAGDPPTFDNENPNSIKHFKSDANPNETICGVCSGAHSEDEVTRTVFSGSKRLDSVDTFVIVY